MFEHSDIEYVDCNMNIVAEYYDMFSIFLPLFCARHFYYFFFQKKWKYFLNFCYILA